MTDAAASAREALRRGSPYTRWLLIFDNANEPGALEANFPGGPGHVLVRRLAADELHRLDAVAGDVECVADLVMLQRFLGHHRDPAHLGGGDSAAGPAG